MFHFNNGGDPLKESVYAYGHPPETKPRYRSKFATKVRVDIWCKKTGCDRTMGPPRDPHPYPQAFLRKHSRLPPVFFDPVELKNTEKKPFQLKSRYLQNKSKKIPNTINQPIPKGNRPCAYPAPPNHMGLFRASEEDPYESRWKKNVQEGECCKNTGAIETSENYGNPEGNFPKPSPDSKLLRKYKTKMDISPENKLGKREFIGGASHNGHTGKIEQGRKDFQKEKFQMPKAIRPCPYPPPPNHMGLFRASEEDPYESRWKKDVHEGECCRNTGAFETCGNLNNPVGKILRESYTKLNIGKRECGGGGASYNGPTENIDRGRRDFLKENALQVVRMPGKRQVRCYTDEAGNHKVDLNGDAPFVLRPGFGQVPKYLAKRKMQMYQEQLALKKSMQRNMRPNCRPLEPSEKDIIIQGIHVNWSLLNSEYLRLPCYTSTQVEREKIRLETKMTELEQDIRLLESTETVWVGNSDSRS